MSALSDARYNNQRIYCKNNGLPLFAPQRCSHDVPWDYGRQREDNEEIFEIITDEESMSKHIIDCPVCHKSFCD